MGPAPHTDELDLVDDLAVDDQLRAFVDDVRSTYAFGPAPETTARLATVLARGLAGGMAPDGHLAAVPLLRGHRDGGAAPPAEPRARRSLADRLQSRRLRLGLGAAVAGLTVFGTGAAGALPGPVQPVFERAVEAVGIDLPEQIRTLEPVPGPAEGAPPVAPGDGSGSEPPGPPPAEGEAPRGQTESRPHVTGPAAPLSDGPGGDGADETPGSQTGRDARPDLPDGVPTPVPPGPTDRPGAGPPPGVPGLDDDAEEAPEERERPGPPDGTPGATGRVAPGSAQPPASGPDSARGLR